MTSLIPFLAMTPDEQAAMGLDEQTRAAIQNYGQTLGYAPPAPTNPDASIPYQAGQLVREGIADAGRAVVAPFRPAIDAAGKAFDAGAQFVGGLANAAIPTAQAASTPPPDDGSAAAARIAQARTQMPMTQPARPAGVAGGGGFGGLERDANKAQAQMTAGVEAGRAAEAGAFQQEKDAARAETELLSKLGQQEAVIVNARNQKMAELDAQTKENEAQRQEREQQEIGKLQTLNAAWRDQKVDPNRLYKNKDGSTNYGKSIGAALMVGLDTLGMAIRGANGPNGALQILDQAVERDIMAQRESIANAKDQAAAQRQYLAELRTQFGSQKAAELAFKESADADFKRQIEGALANTKDEGARIAGQKIVAQIEQRSAERQIELARMTGQDFMQNIQLRTGIRSAASNAAMQREELNARMAAAGAKPNAFEKEGADIQGNAQTVLQKIAALREYVLGPDGVGREVFPTDAAKKATAMAKDLQLALKEQKKMGTLDKGSEAFLESLITSDPTQMNQGALKAQLDALEASTKSETVAQLRARGLIREQPRLATQGAPE